MLHKRFCSLFSHHGVCVHEHTLAVVRQSPAVQLGQRHPQVRALHQGQMSRIARVHNIHQAHLIKDALQRIPGVHSTLLSLCRVFTVLHRGRGEITCMVPQHEAPPAQPGSWWCCGFVTTGREPTLPWRSCRLWPTSHKPRLHGHTNSSAATFASHNQLETWTLRQH